MLTETHFTDDGKSYEPAEGIDGTFRLGRFVTFLGSVMLELGDSAVRGLAVDDNTALTIDSTGRAEVFGEKHVYFATTSSVGELSVQTTTDNRTLLTTPYFNLHWASTADGLFNMSQAWAQPTESFAAYRLNAGVLQRDLTVGEAPPFGH